MQAFEIDTDQAERVATRIEIAKLKEAMSESTMIHVTQDQVEAMTLASRTVVPAGGGAATANIPTTEVNTGRKADPTKLHLCHNKLSLFDR